MIFMNSFNAVHAFTELLKWRDYIDNVDLLQQQPKFELANEWRTKSIFHTFDILLILVLLYFLLLFFKRLFFPSKHIKIMFKVFKLILNINIEGKVCSHHTVQFCEREQKAIRYDVKMVLILVVKYFANNCTHSVHS